MLDLDFDDIEEQAEAVEPEAPEEAPRAIIVWDDVAQGSAEWHALRAGKWTGSRAEDLIARNAKDYTPLKARKDYVASVVLERLTGEAANDGGSFKQTRWGHEQEPNARAAYEIHRGVLTHTPPFVRLAALPNVGMSPDALVLERKRIVGGVEIKCPHDGRIHINTLRNGMPPEHMPQVQWELWVAGAQWWDFVSYDPRLPERLQLFIQRIEPDLDMHALFEREVELAEKEVQAQLDTLNAYTLEEAA